LARSRLTIGIRGVVLMTLVALASASAAYGLIAGDPVAPPTKQQTGKQLYRKYCGQCHALTAALAAGFGSGNGLGTNGGPSFDHLRVPFNLSVLAVTQPFIGHEVIVHKMKWAQIREVALFVQAATKKHSVVAQNIDG
jgi:mono/diheme cytochrome c family protein